MTFSLSNKLRLVGDSALEMRVRAGRETFAAEQFDATAERESDIAKAHYYRVRASLARDRAEFEAKQAKRLEQLALECAAVS